MLFPPAANWARIGVTPREVNGHAQCEYSVKTGQWSQPKFVKDPYLRIHGLAPALNYGQQAYEGLKAFRTPQNEISVFRPDFHASRLAHSMSFVSMPPIPKETFLEAVNLAVAGNAEYVPPHETEALMYIRPVVFGTTAHLALSPPEDYIFCVYAQPGSAYHGVKPLDALILEQFDRAAPFGTGSAKVGGNYAPVYKWSGMAMKEGFALTLHLDSQTRTEIEEFSTSAFVGINQEGDNVTMVVPDSKNVIASVTSDSCQQLAKSYGWKVEVRPIKFEELATFSEVMAAGTAAALLPVKSITHKSTNSKFVFQDGSDQAGPCSQRLAADMKAIQKGKTEDVNGWCLKIKEVKV